jgi:hypothetical protein
VPRRVDHDHRRGGGALLAVLSEALPIDEQRRAECAFWTSFWGQRPGDQRLWQLNAWVHREYRRLFERCLRDHWPEFQGRWPAVRAQLLRSLITFVNGITTSAVASPADWPPREQVRQLELQLTLLRDRALGGRGGDIMERAAWNSR